MGRVSPPYIRPRVLQTLFTQAAGLLVICLARFTLAPDICVCIFAIVPSKSLVMNYCMSDMYDMSHGMSGGYAVPSGGEYCMYGGEGFSQCESQPLHHHPVSVEQAWPPGEPYGCPFTGGNQVFKSELCSVEVPLSHYHQPDFFSDGRPDFSHIQWMQAAHKKGTESSR